MYRYNMQSGEARGSYPQSATPSERPTKSLSNLMKPGSVTKITPDGFASKQIGELGCEVVHGAVCCLIAEM